MSSSGSDSASSFHSEEWEDVSDYDIEEDPSEQIQPLQTPSHSQELYNLPYADEPLASEEWLAQYKEDMKETEMLEQSFKDRLCGKTPVSEWCKCGNCKRESLQNASECYCCTELEGCVDALGSDLVREDLADGTVLKCVTEHRGFNEVCQKKWSLRLAAGKYKTKGKAKYRQTGTENEFLRSISYREFSRLIYGILGNKRIPLPACAYVAIRGTFPAQKDETFAGFDLDED